MRDPGDVGDADLMDRRLHLHQQSLVVRADRIDAAFQHRCVDGAKRPTLEQPNDDYCDSIGRYEQAVKPSDTRADSARWQLSYA